jgi:uncharacterized protein (DUF433 family)
MSTVPESLDVTVSVPIRVDEDGGRRIGGTRVHLETVIRAHRMGSTPEQIVESFPSVTSSDVYAVLAWYLQHQREADAYVAERDRQADELRKHIEAAQGQHTVTRATLAERLAAKGRG